MASVTRPVGPVSAAVGDVVGTCLHGRLEDRAVREAFVDAVDAAERTRPPQSTGGQSPYDAATALVDVGTSLQPE